MSRHLERLLKLDSLLRTRQRQTVPSLAEALEVSQRTIRNDLAFLRDRFNAPLEFSRTQGHYYTNPEWRLPSISLSQGELFALTLGARMLDAYAGFSYVQELRSAVECLSEQLPEQTWIDLQQIADERFVFRTGAETYPDPDIWKRLVKACRNSRRVSMRYFTASCNAQSEQKLDPYLLHIYRGINPYVIGFCHKRQAISWFRIDRIRELQVLKENFIRDSNFDAKEYLIEISQSEVGGKPVTVTIWFDASTAPFVRERRWHPSQEIQEHPDNSLTLRLIVGGLNELKRWILGYGKGAIVQEPAELIAMVREEGEGITRNYKLFSI
ncbi:MAG: WYL domain-containing protein [Coleofasciculaceae cyanobacterium]